MKDWEKKEEEFEIDAFCFYFTHFILKKILDSREKRVFSQERHFIEVFHLQRFQVFLVQHIE
jgi:hypothetical protein